MSGEKQESSVLFSLKELMNLEEDRIKQEDDDAKQRADEERRRLDMEAQRKREEEEARVAAEQERRRLEDSRQREESTRLEAIRQAEIEKRRIEAERAAQLEAMSKQQEHQRQLAMIQQDEGKKKLRNTLIGVGVGSVLLIGGGLGVYFGKIKPEADAKQAAIEAQSRADKEEAEKSKRDAADAQAKVMALMDDLKNAKDDASRKELAQKLADAQADAAKKAKAVGGGGTGGPKTDTGGGSKPASKCPPGDPLCGL
jgi:colicin import membrane protein